MYRLILIAILILSSKQLAHAGWGVTWPPKYLKDQLAWQLSFKWGNEETSYTSTSSDRVQGMRCDLPGKIKSEKQNVINLEP